MTDLPVVWTYLPFTPDADWLLGHSFKWVYCRGWIVSTLAEEPRRRIETVCMAVRVCMNCHVTDLLSHSFSRNLHRVTNRHLRLVWTQLQERMHWDMIAARQPHWSVSQVVHFFAETAVYGVFLVPDFKKQCKEKNSCLSVCLMESVESLLRYHTALSRIFFYHSVFLSKKPQAGKFS